MKRLLPAILAHLLVVLAIQGQTLVEVEGSAFTYTLIVDGRKVIRDEFVEDFRIATTETTIAQWKEFVDDTNLDYMWEDHYCGDIADLSPFDTCPIPIVKIDNALKFCNWLSRRHGFKPVYFISDDRVLRKMEANGYRLPTAVEWDYAARGGRYTRGYIYAGSNDYTEVAWINRSGDVGTLPVGSKDPNELGLYDMTGNIREWTWPEIGIPFPLEKQKETVHLRGGSWTTTPEHARLDYDRPTWVYQWATNGFRLARNAD